MFIGTTTNSGEMCVCAYLLWARFNFSVEIPYLLTKMLLHVMKTCSCLLLKSMLLCAKDMLVFAVESGFFFLKNCSSLLLRMVMLFQRKVLSHQ